MGPRVSSLCAGAGAPAPEQSVPMRLTAGLRYGENPHQPAAAYLDASLAEAGRGGVGTATLHHGKEARALQDKLRFWQVQCMAASCCMAKQELVGLTGRRV